MTVQGPVKKQQPDGMSHRGLAGHLGVLLSAAGGADWPFATYHCPPLAPSPAAPIGLPPPCALPLPPWPNLTSLLPLPFPWEVAPTEPPDFPCLAAPCRGSLGRGDVEMGRGNVRVLACAVVPMWRSGALALWGKRCFVPEDVGVGTRWVSARHVGPLGRVVIGAVCERSPVKPSLIPRCTKDIPAITSCGPCGMALSLLPGIACLPACLQVLPALYRHTVHWRHGGVCLRTKAFSLSCESSPEWCMKCNRQ